MSPDTNIKNPILIKLYNQYFENFVVGLSINTLENLSSSGNTNEVRIVLNELLDNFLISLVGNRYKITVFGIKYLEEKELVDNSKQQPRNEILKVLKEYYEKDTNNNVSHEIIVKKLDLSGPIEILSQMKYLQDEGYLHLQMALGGSFHTRLTNAGYQLSKSLS